MRRRLRIAGFLNVYTVLKFGTDQLWRFYRAPFSVGLARFSGLRPSSALYLTASIPIAPVQEAFSSPLPQRKEEDAARRLEEAPDPARRMKKRDYIVMLAITAVYAHFRAGDKSGKYGHPRARFCAPGGGMRDFSDAGRAGLYRNAQILCGAMDRGICAYTPLSMAQTLLRLPKVLQHRYRNMFRWQILEVNEEAKYILIIKDQGMEMEIREIGLMDEEDALTPVFNSADPPRGHPSPGCRLPH